MPKKKENFEAPEDSENDDYEEDLDELEDEDETPGYDKYPEAIDSLESLEESFSDISDLIDELRDEVDTEELYQDEEEAFNRLTTINLNDMKYKLDNIRNLVNRAYAELEEMADIEIFNSSVIHYNHKPAKKKRSKRNDFF